MNFVDPNDEDEVLEEPSARPTDYSYKNLKNVAAFTPEEQAGIEAHEGTYRDDHLKAIDKELKRASPEQRKVLEEERRKVASQPSQKVASPKIDFVDPNDEFEEPAKEAPKEEGFLGTLKNPWTLWTEESAPARLVSAYQKGVFDKPIGDLVQNAGDAVSKFKVSDVVDAAVKNPGKMAGELVNAVVADPYLLLPVFWQALGGRLAIAGAQIAGRVGAVAGGALEAGATGAGVSGAVSAAKQLDEAGFIDPGKLSQEMGIGAGLAAGISVVGSVAGGMVRRVSKTEAPVSQDIMTSAKFHMSEGDDIMTAMNRAMEEKGVPSKERGPLVEALKETKSPEVDKNFLQLRKDVQALLPEESPAVKEQTPAQARKELGQMAKEMKATREAAEASDAEFAKMTEELKEFNAPKIADELPDTKPYRNEAAEEAAAAKERVESGIAKAHGEEISTLSARAEQIMSQKTLTPTQAKELVDIKTYLELAPELDVPVASLPMNEVPRIIGEGVSKAPLNAFSKTQGGAVDPKLLAAMAVGGGALALSPEEKRGQILGALGLAALAVGSMKVRPKSLDAVERMFESKPQMRVEAMTALQKQRGIIDPQMGKWLALGTGGAAIGGYLSDDKGKGAVLGAALALGGGVALRAGARMLKSGKEGLDNALKRFDGLKRDPAKAKQIDEVLSAHSATVSSVGLAADRMTYAIKKLVPDAAKRESLIHAIQEGRIGELTGNERTAAELFQREMREFGEYGQSKGVLDDLIGDGTYVTQLWDDGANTRSLFSAMKGATRFAEERLIPSYKEGMAMGLKPKTLDIAEIGNIYAKNLARAIANKELLEVLKTSVTAGTEGLGSVKKAARQQATSRAERLAAEKLPDTTSPLMKAEDAPGDYVEMLHPQLMGWRVNPEMAEPLSYLFSAKTTPAIIAATNAVSSVAKQGLLGMSLFHLKSLAEVGANIALGLSSPGVLLKAPAMYRMLREGASGDFADQALQAGLKVGHHASDLNTNIFAEVTDKITGALDKIPVAGKVVSAPLKAGKWAAKETSRITFDVVHSALKLSTAQAAYSKALVREAKEAASNPGYSPKAPQEILKEVSGAVNDLYGGVDWRRIAGNIENKFLHKMFTSATNPAGMPYTQISLLAPDWFISTLRAGAKGIISTGKSFVPGKKLSVAEDLYRRYLLGGLVVTAAMQEVAQQAATGTSFWDNPDPTFVYFRDGTRIQLAKHYNEIFHWLSGPRETLVNKLGYVPKETIAQLGNMEYFSGKGSPPMQDTSVSGRVVHAAKGMLPISGQELIAGRPGAAASGALGVPRLGRSREERMEMRRKRIEKRRSAEGREEERRRKERKLRMKEFGGE